MTAEPMHPARGSTPSRGSGLLSRWRVARSLAVLLAAGALTAACHDDDRATLSPSADGPSNRAPAAPLAQGIGAPDQSIAILASPARPLGRTDAATSPAAAPLAPPVIHTVD